MSARKKQKTDQNDKNVSNMLFSANLIFTSEKWINQYIHDCYNIDESDIYRTYYAKIRFNVTVDKYYLKFVKKQLNYDNFDDCITYFTLTDWCSNTINRDEDYVRKIHYIAMTQIYSKYMEFKKRINSSINFITNLLNSA